MLEISPSAATLISLACRSHDLGEKGGMRIFPSPDQDQHTLRLRYVAGPHPKDLVVDSGGDAHVFVRGRDRHNDRSTRPGHDEWQRWRRH